MQDWRLLIFDFDGTLADTYPAFVAALDDVIARHGLRAIGREELEGLRGGHGRALMRRLGVRWWQVPRVSASMLAAMTACRHTLRPFDGVPAALEALAARGVVLAIVSSNSESNVRAVLGPAAELVRVYECGAAVFGKAAKFRRVLRRTGIAASAALTVGDELRDLEAAREAGIAFGAVGWGYTRAEALRAAGPDLFFDHPRELAMRDIRAARLTQG